MRIHPFDALRPPDDMADKVSSVPYDVVSREEAAKLAAGNPYSILHVSRPEIDFPDGTNPYSDAVYEKALENFNRLIRAGALIREGRPCVYIYEQSVGDHRQTGVVACCHIEDYEKNLIKKHEKTRIDKENDRTKHVLLLRANTGPVFLMYRENHEINLLIANFQKEMPIYDFKTSDGVRHTVWRIYDFSELQNLFKKVPAFYIADGHHRAAAAVRAGKELRDKNKNHTGNEEYNWFLSVLFPASHLKILPYNRLVKDLNGLSKSDFIKKVGERFRIREKALPSPQSKRNVSMYLAGKWYGLEWDSDPKRDTDPLRSLDVSYLNENMLEPILGISDMRTDQRIEFVGGTRGTDFLQKMVDSGTFAVAFSMYPVSVDEVMHIADAGLIMPPKSTWFEPKLRSGLLIHTL